MSACFVADREEASVHGRSCPLWMVCLQCVCLLCLPCCCRWRHVLMEEAGGLWPQQPCQPPPPAAECRPPSLGASPPQARPPQRLDEGQLSSTLCLPPKSWEDSESQVSLSDGRPQQGEPRDRLPVLSVMRSLGRVRPELA